MKNEQRKRTYDHRLRELVRKTGDLEIALRHGVPRSTAAGWLRAEQQEVVTIDVFSMSEQALQAEVLELRRRLAVLVATMRLLLVLVRISGARLEGRRLLSEDAKDLVVATVERSREVLPLRSVLRVLGLSFARYYSWARADADCHPEEQGNCPRRKPNQLTIDEVAAIKEMAMSPDYRHVSTSRLAILAQRLGRVYASASTWARLIRENGWRRPRMRIHPGKPKEGLRTTRPDEAWHVDVTVVRLLDGSKAYIHAAIDSFSRRILAFRVVERLDIGNAFAVLAEAAQKAVSLTGQRHGDDDGPMVVVDGGVENFNHEVDKLFNGRLLRRVLALTDISFSNSLIEAFWRIAKHQWLFLNNLDTVKAMERLFAFYVKAHNTEIPHSAFRGQTPDEMYFGKGDDVPDELATARSDARKMRVAWNRKVTCEDCTGRGGRLEPGRLEVV